MNNSDTLKSGICLRCKSNDIYTTKDQPKRGDRMQIPVSSMKWFSLDTYICINCCHFEELINEKELKDNKIIEKIKGSWSKVKRADI
jgi:hypothetical protein